MFLFGKTIQDISCMIIISYKQPDTPQTCCKLWILPACWKLSTSWSKSVDFYGRLHQVVANLSKSDLLQLDIYRLAESCWNNVGYSFTNIRLNFVFPGSLSLHDVMIITFQSLPLDMQTFRWCNIACS